MRIVARARILGLAMLVSMVASVAPASGHSVPLPPYCADRILVLAAMPLELNPLLEAATVEREVQHRNRTFWVGRLGGHRVVMAMTRIGLVNARQTTLAAFDRFPCFSAVVFSGVAGSKRKIADMTIPARWTLDDGRTWIRANVRMLKTARALEGTDAVQLDRAVPVGDAACLCPGVDTIATPVSVTHQPRVYVGGDGISSDTYGDKALPCVPSGGDEFGCTPCMPGSTPADAAYFASNAPSYLDPAFLQGFFTPPGETTDTMEAQDMESAAVGEVARANGVPFLAIRAASDGEGDSLNLPGFPFQFFAYRQLAGDNAATTTIAFLERWPA